MKKFIGSFLVILFITNVAFSQTKCSVEVLYFKAKLCGCKARVCDALEANVRSLIQEEYPDMNIEFKTVSLADAANKDLIAKHNARSQTVVMIQTKKKNETVVDLTAIVQTYSRDRNKEKFKNDLTIKVGDQIKSNR